MALRGLVKLGQSELVHGSFLGPSEDLVVPKSLLSMAHADSSLEGGTAQAGGVRVLLTGATLLKCPGPPPTFLIQLQEVNYLVKI